MWAAAKALRPELKSLNELDEQGEFRLTPGEYDQCLKKVHDNLKGNKARGRTGFVYEQGAGVRGVQDRADPGSRFGSEREAYNGRDGGRIFTWYSRQVFGMSLA